MPAYWGVTPQEWPVRREILVALQKKVPPKTWRRTDDPLVRAGISGQGASLLVLTWTQGMLAAERAAGVRLLQQLGVQRGHRVANNLAGGLVTPGSLLLGDVVEELGALDIAVGETRCEQSANHAWQWLQRLSPEVLVLEAQTADALLRAMPPTCSLRPAVVLWLHRGAPTSMPRMPATFSNARVVHWLAVPEVLSFFAHSCNGEHFHCDSSLEATVVDPQSLRPAAKGWLRVVWQDFELGRPSYLVPWEVQLVTDTGCGHFAFQFSPVWLSTWHNKAAAAPGALPRATS